MATEEAARQDREGGGLGHGYDPSAIRCMADIVRVHAVRRPDAVALECDGRQLTFAGWYERSMRIAAALAAEGVEAGSRVAVLARNGLEIFELTFGAALLNAVAVQVNWRLAGPEVAKVLSDSESGVLVVAQEFVPVCEAIAEDLAGLRRVVVIGSHERWTSYEDWVRAHEPRDPGTVAAGSDVAMQLYTSGTTGLPKGAMLTNDNLFCLVDANRWFELDPDDSVNIAAMPLFHIGGLGWSVAGLTFGCRTVVLPEVDPKRLLDAIRRGATHVFVVPAVIQFLLAVPGIHRSDFASLRKLVYGASPISVAVLTRAMEVMGCEFMQVYGLTETTGAITQLLPSEHDPAGRPELLRSCGRPFPWVDVRVAEVEGGREVAVGEIGELWIRSPQVMAGYWRNPEATRAAITPDGWFRTGDVGYRDADGYVYLYDRVKDMVISGGENVYPVEVENVLMGHPRVADVAVIGVPDERWGEAVKAIVVPTEGGPPDPAELIAHCRGHLAGFKCPRSIDFAVSLPRNPSGKLLKRELRRPYWESADRQIG